MLGGIVSSIWEDHPPGSQAREHPAARGTHNIIQGKLKIADFGWAVYNQDSFRETFCGTPLYLSPDVLKGDQYNDKVDNWAIGIITYEMMVGRIPFKITQESEMEKIVIVYLRRSPRRSSSLNTWASLMWLKTSSCACLIGTQTPEWTLRPF